MAAAASEHLARNASSGLIPSPSDLVLALPRLAIRAKSWLLSDGYANNTTILGSSGGIFTQSATGKMSSAAPDGDMVSGLFSFLQTPVFQRLSNVDGIFSYVLSRWAVATFFIAIILNRSHVYAAPRRHLILTWQSRLFLRILPIAGFLYQILILLQAMQCQSGSYPLPTLVTGLEKRTFATLNHNQFIHGLSSTLLFWQDDTRACTNAGMIPAGGDKLQFVGSSTMLWPLFITLCLSQLVETVSCSLEGRSPMAETGMTIFEHSLAFAEAEAVVRANAGMGFFGWPRQSPSASTTAGSTSAPSPSATAAADRFMVTPTMLLSRLNVPPEVLLIGFISSCSHLSSHLLAVAGLQARFRLVNTAIWGVCFMSVFLWSFIKFSSPQTIQDVGVLRYPTVCIIGFVPHLLIVAGILVCGFIYSVALITAILSSPKGSKTGDTFAQRLKWAFDNMQANVSLANIKISWQEEFYTTLLKVGFTIMTAASEAVYFNEGTDVSVNPMTWLEEKRLGEVSRARKLAHRLKQAIPAEIQGDSTVADGVGLIQEDQILEVDGRQIISGYARERKTTEHSRLGGAAATKEEGVGGSQRSGRWLLSLHLLRETISLLCCVSARVALWLLKTFSYRNEPDWLLFVARYEIGKPVVVVEHNKQHEFWDLDDQNQFYRPTDLEFDVEGTMRRNPASVYYGEQQLDDQLYSWWLHNGQWGERDSSGSFRPLLQDDDVTSVMTDADDASVASGWETFSDSEHDGRRTPTRRHPYRGLSRSPEPEDGLARLAGLLNPRTLAEKEEARLLSQRLLRQGPMTRSAYKKDTQRETLHLLSPQAQARALANDPLTPEEEEQLLESIILSKRAEKLAARRAEASAGDRGSWSSGAEGMGSAGPQCVICHSSPRTILVWPCRCLSLCEDCRVSLAMNNFATCVCCRRDVVAFSRLFVP